MVKFFPTTIPSRSVVCRAGGALRASRRPGRSIFRCTLSSGSTLSVSCAADLMALMLLGPHQAMVVAVAGAWTQCTFNVRRPYPPYRTIFSMAAEAITMQATGLVYLCAPRRAGAVAHGDASKGARRGDRHVLLRQHRPAWPGPSRCPRARTPGRCGTTVSSGADRASWSPAPPAPSAAVVIERGDHWMAILMLAPVYLTYRTYQVFLGRIEDQRRHVEETQKLHSETIEALLQAQAGGAGARGREGAPRRHAAQHRRRRHHDGSATGTCC